MRVIANGGYVIDVVLDITAATNSNPLTVTIPSSGGATATPINTGVYSSYAPGEVITLAGGTFGQPAQVTVSTTEVLSLLFRVPPRRLDMRLEIRSRLLGRHQRQPSSILRQLALCPSPS